MIEGLSLLLMLFVVSMLPVFIAMARDKPEASIAMMMAWCLGCPGLGWFVGLYLALRDEE